jgi:hypothetical protein
MLLVAAGLALAAGLAAFGMLTLTWAEVVAHLPMAAGLAAAVGLYALWPRLRRAAARLLRCRRPGGAV